MEKIRIFSIYFNNAKHFFADCLSIIYAGNKKNYNKKNIFVDNIDENISNKNKYFGEITAHYWVWRNWLQKNKKIEYIGFCQYRRFLDFRNFNTNKPAFSKISFDKMQKILKNTYKEKIIYENIKDYDVIISKPFDFGYKRVYNQPDDIEGQNEIQKFKKSILKLFPDYKPYIDNFLNGNKMSLGLIFLMKTELFEEWMEWLFSVYEEYEKITDYSNYDGTYQQRMPAFMAERYFNVWLHYKISNNNIKVAFKESYLVEETRKDNKHMLKKIINIKNEINNDTNKKHKIITILGLKIKFKVKNKNVVTTKKKEYFIAKTNYASMDFKVITDINYKKYINILAPAPKYNMSAGPLSIYFLAKKLCDWGYNVRIIPFCEETTDLDWKKVLLSHSNKFLNVIDKITYDRGFIENKRIFVNPNDMTIATWYATAYYAHKIQQKCNDKNFIYMIQDYESDFFAKDSNYAFAENSYNLPHYSLFSTDILKDFFVTNDIGFINSKNNKYISYPCPSNSYLPPFEIFSQRNKKKKFVFYAREHAPRNAYELSVLSIINAIEEKVFNLEEWEFYGIGSIDSRKIELAPNVYLKQLPNMSLEEYKKLISTFDLALSLMLSPHTSMPPIDLALSGVVTITNNSQIKTNEKFKEISRNIISTNLNINDITNAFKESVEMINKISERYNNAKNTKYPSDWSEVFRDEHFEFFNQIIKVEK